MDLATILNWLQAIFSDPHWVGAIGTWFAGFCTLAAVLVSLWLAYDRNKVKLRVKASAMGSFKLSADGEVQAIARIAIARILVTNVGRVSGHITGTGFKVGRGKRKREIVIPEPSKTIQPREDVSFSMPIDKLADGLAANGYGEEDIKRLKAVVASATGETPVVKVEQSLVDALTQRIRQKEKSHA